MKATLLTTPFESVYQNLKGLSYPQPSLGLMYIAAVLKKNNISVSYFDMQFHKFQEAVSEIRDSDIVGLTCVTPTAQITYDMAGKIKSLFPGKPVAIGGAHPTALPQEVINHDFIDFVIIGEGEYTFLELVQNLKKRNFKGIKGLIYKEGIKLCITPGGR